MSLLLEALKKAELAKQNARAEAPAHESPQERHADSVKPLMTRERLPDISQPLEILTDDLPSAGQKALARPPLALQQPVAAEPQPVAAVVEPAPAAPPARASEQAQAEQLFRLNELDYNPRRPFYLMLGVLALVGIGYGGYVWWQLRPKSSVTPAVLAHPAPAAPAAIATAPPAPAGSAVPTVKPDVPVIPPIQAAASRPVARTVAAPPSPIRSGPAFRRDVSATPGEAPAAAMPIAVRPSSLAVDPLTDQAYDAYQKGDLNTARDSYQRLLTREPNNRDALLGLAAIDLRLGNVETAEARYQRLVELDPRDAQAVAGLAALRGPIDPVASESQLKNLIALQPDAMNLYFALGNLYARQARWSEAQEAYFKAYTSDPENADYAFNLAVSLDQLRQKSPALDYYRRALVLSDKHPGGFDRAQALARVQELGK
jgi:tetratricopeptide (TPR) repeat protein